MFQVFADSMMVATRLERTGTSHRPDTRPHRPTERHHVLDLLFGKAR